MSKFLRSMRRWRKISPVGVKIDSAKFRIYSEIFDASFYVSRNPDVAKSGADPLAHYLRHGWREGRNPHPLFNASWYRAAYLAGNNELEPLAHYVLTGWKEGCNPHPLFDSNYYLTQNEDVAAAGANPLVHYIRFGWREGRDPTPLFDVDWYRAKYLADEPDVEPLSHYVRNGWLSGCSPHELFDVVPYLEENPDLKESGIEPLAHYLHHGWREGRNPHPLFNVSWYRAAYLAGNNELEPLAHYVLTGWKEGRNPHPLFDSSYYLTQNTDVAADGANPLVHYIRFGWREGHDPNPLFDVDWYRAKYLADEPDVEPLSHYVRNGWLSGCSPHELFDVVPYLEENPDLKENRIEPLAHYLKHGWIERRKVTPRFDDEQYLVRSRAARESGIAPLAHFAMSGARDARVVSTPFDAHYYTAVNPDLVNLSEDEAWQHFLRFGYAEGRLSALVRERACEPDEQTQTPQPSPMLSRGGHPRGKPHYSGPLVISGFHRSGTSMTANLFANAGLFLGERLLGSKYSNPYGHFEDTEVIAFHDRVLERSGTSWRAEAPFFPILADEDWHWLFEFATRRSAFASWGFKDPRNCLFLPQWSTVFPDMAVLFVYRPCVECVHSLKRRAAKDLLLGKAIRINREFWQIEDLAIKMYIVYAEAALRFLENFPGRSAVINLEDILAGRDIVDESRRAWGYQLSDSHIGDVLDSDAITRYGPNEVVYDSSLLDRVAEIEQRFSRRMKLGFVKTAEHRMEGKA